MRGLTKKHHIDLATLVFVGPDDKVRQAREAMRVLGFKEPQDDPSVEQAIPWRESRYFNEKEKLPGMMLLGARYREDLTQVALSERTGIPRRHISEMENGKRPIGKTNARKLAAALGIDPRRLVTV